MMEMRFTRLTTIVLMAALMLAIFAVPSEETFAASRSLAKPKITKATVYDTNNVKLTWSKAKGAVKYKVYCKKGSGKYRLVKTTTKRTYYSKNLAYGTKYTYKVKAVSAKGKTNTSKIKRAYTKPAKPKLTKATVYNTNNVKLTWSKTKGAVKYKVYRKKGEYGEYVLVKTTTKKTYYSKSLAYGTKYTYKVKAVSAKGKTNTSKIKRAYTKPAKPVLKAELSDFTTVKLTWNKTKGAVEYKLYEKEGNGKYELYCSTGKDETEYEVYQGIGTTSTYKIKAVSANGKTNTSTAKTVTTHTHDWEAVYTEEDQGCWEVDVWECAASDCEFKFVGTDNLDENGWTAHNQKHYETEGIYYEYENVMWSEIKEAGGCALWECLAPGCNFIFIEENNNFDENGYDNHCINAHPETGGVGYSYGNGVNIDEVSTGNWISNWQTVVDYYKCRICGTCDEYADSE